MLPADKFLLAHFDIPMTLVIQIISKFKTSDCAM
jgi:hypothetical protein